MSPKTRRIVWLILLLVLASVILLAGYLAYALHIGRRVAVTISKETTYITEPLRADGYPDYMAALNQRASKGVTPENNAAVLFWKAMGPTEIGAKERDKYFKMLGMPSLREEGDYFVTLDKYLDRQKDTENSKGPMTQEEHNRIWDQLRLGMKRPWSKQEFPVLAGWVEANEKPLTLLAEASRRPRRYDPLLSDKDDMVLAVWLPAVQQYRDVARALIARAMLWASEGMVDESWEDLLACRRLARLVGQGATLIDALVAITIDKMAGQGDQGLLSCVNLTASQIAKMRNDLDQLPPMPKMVDKLDLSERFTYLDAVSYAARHGVSSLAAVLGGAINGPLKVLLDAIGNTADWNVALRMGNYWYDRLVDAGGKTRRTERKAALDEIDKDMGEVVKDVFDWKSLAVSVLGVGRQTISERIGRILVTLFLPALSTAVNAEDRATMQAELNKLTFALAGYHADNGSYPAKLADLAPKYVADIPKDIFSDSDLHYKQEGGGYLLYSVGANGKDDGGRGIEDRYKGEDSSEDWDDLVVRVPAAPPR